MAGSLLDLLFPRPCVGCGRFGTEWCALCASLARPCWHETFVGTLSVLSLFSFADRFGHQAVTELKYGGRPRGVARMVSGICGCQLLRSACFVPVPISTTRRKSRGYGQAEVLARCFAQANAGSVVNCLGRLEGESLVGKTRVERQALVQGMFQVIRPISFIEGSVILVDDVMTTGSTLLACAEALQSAGVEVTRAVTLAYEA